ncbi:MAG: 2,3-bisphosphoglycerate-independent phosphoglycerate mutase [Desulfobulbaceae bacterium]|jgi:2,3-bisphosphoglycerate-independent phosphoglycerate mutase|nr:2,3-bisphosphoglycerate-independent phosphoglycerate mutase [Desulfobulbaceae bacterium]
MTALQPLDGYSPPDGPVVLVIMDGVGLGRRDESDGVFMAYTPLLDRLLAENMLTPLKAHGVAVGLPSDDDMGNSEVGHNAIGAGRIFAQGAKLVNNAIASGAIFATETWRKILAAGATGVVHFIGLLSDGNVHSHINHLFALLDGCAAKGIAKVRVHVLLDGRDVGEKTALDYLLPLEEKLATLTNDGRDYRIASGGGRMVTTMDRYNANWQVVENGWRAHVLGIGRPFLSATEAVKTYYAEDPAITDQYLPSFVITEGDEPVGMIGDSDAVLFFNFRGDRAIEISRAFEESDFHEFERIHQPKVFFAGMMQYDGDALIPKNYLVGPPALDHTISEYLCASGVTSYALSETQKFGHVTYFWNGNKSGYINRDLELYEEVPSDKVRFDERPWMQAGPITDKAIAAVQSGKYRFIRLNYPNGDMVGHTGVPQAVRIAVEAVDLSLNRLLKAVEKAGGIAVVIADHGNADCMWTENKGKREPMVAHTKNPVPFIVVNFCERLKISGSGVENPGLVNVAASLCQMLGFKPPADYEPSLVVVKAASKTSRK